jgi:hypothetical protein
MKTTAWEPSLTSSVKEGIYLDDPVTFVYGDSENKVQEERTTAMRAILLGYHRFLLGLAFNVRDENGDEIFNSADPASGAFMLPSLMPALGDTFVTFRAIIAMHIERAAYQTVAKLGEEDMLKAAGAVVVNPGNVAAADDTTNAAGTLPAPESEPTSEGTSESLPSGGEVRSEGSGERSVSVAE